MTIVFWTTLIMGSRFCMVLCHSVSVRVKRAVNCGLGGAESFNFLFDQLASPCPEKTLPVLDLPEMNHQAVPCVCLYTSVSPQARQVAKVPVQFLSSLPNFLLVSTFQHAPWVCFPFWLHLVGISFIFV